MSVIRLGRLTKTLKQCSSVSFNYEINKSYSPKKDNRWYRTRYVSCNGKRFWFISCYLLMLYIHFFDFVIQCKKLNVKRFRLILRNNNKYFLLFQHKHHNLILQITNFLKNNLMIFLKIKMILLSMMKIHLKIQIEIRL